MTPMCDVCHFAALLAHLDSEPERLKLTCQATVEAMTQTLKRERDEAVARAREEQVELCARDAEERVGCVATSDDIRSTPLDATPLADENRALRERAQKAEAERDEAVEALRCAQELLDCSLGVPYRPGLSEPIRAVLAKHKEGL